MTHSLLEGSADGVRGPPGTKHLAGTGDELRVEVQCRTPLHALSVCGVNESAVHWDMVCDLRQGGTITVDGEELQRDGRFLV